MSPACDVVESVCNAHGHELGIICFCIFLFVWLLFRYDIDWTICDITH